jgi:hypothetical protein
MVELSDDFLVEAAAAGIAADDPHVHDIRIGFERLLKAAPASACWSRARSVSGMRRATRLVGSAPPAATRSAAFRRHEIHCSPACTRFARFGKGGDLRQP